MELLFKDMNDWNCQRENKMDGLLEMEERWWCNMHVCYAHTCVRNWERWLCMHACFNWHVWDLWGHLNQKYMEASRAIQTYTSMVGPMLHKFQWKLSMRDVRTPTVTGWNDFAWLSNTGSLDACPNQRTGERSSVTHINRSIGTGTSQPQFDRVFNTELLPCPLLHVTSTTSLPIAGSRFWSLGWRGLSAGEYVFLRFVSPSGFTSDRRVSIVRNNPLGLT
jgi:hypothetical protein